MLPPRVLSLVLIPCLLYSLSLCNLIDFHGSKTGVSYLISRQLFIRFLYFCSWGSCACPKLAKAQTEFIVCSLTFSQTSIFLYSLSGLMTPPSSFLFKLKTFQIICVSSPSSVKDHLPKALLEQPPNYFLCLQNLSLLRHPPHCHWVSFVTRN